MDRTQGVILVIDDQDANRMICRINLGPKRAGYQILEASNAMDGLSLARAHSPDVILLDVMMPVMNGFEMLEVLKHDQKLKVIPVLMLTAKAEENDIVLALEKGAQDYLRKPFNVKELIARVDTLYRLKISEDQLRGSMSLLEHKAELGLMAGGLAHDMNNILACVQVVDMIPGLLDDPKNKPLILGYISAILDAMKLGVEISKGFTSYLQGMDDEMQVSSLISLLKPIDTQSRRFRGKIVREFDESAPPIKCKRHQIKRVVVNLFVNACQAMQDSDVQVCTLRIWAEGGFSIFLIRDTGIGIAEETLLHIFDEGFTTKDSGTGLGLYMVRNIVEAHGGRLEVVTKLGEGTTFTLLFPSILD